MMHRRHVYLNIYEVLTLRKKRPLKYIWSDRIKILLGAKISFLIQECLTEKERKKG